MGIRLIHYRSVRRYFSGCRSLEPNYGRSGAIVCAIQTQLKLTHKIMLSVCLYATALKTDDVPRRR